MGLYVFEAERQVAAEEFEGRFEHGRIAAL